MVDGEVKGIFPENVGAAFSVNVSIPKVGITDCNGSSGTMVNGKVQCGDGIASCSIDVCMCGCRGACSILCAMPYETVTSYGVDSGIVTVVDGKV